MHLSRSITVKLLKADINDEAIKSAMEEIVKLNPKPGNSLIESSKSTQHIIPDFILTDSKES